MAHSMRIKRPDNPYSLLIKILIIVTMILAVIVYINDNKEEIVSVMTQNKSYSLPIYSVETEDTVVSITFDAAWGDEDLEEILGILDKHNCRATFFVTGEWALKYPEAVKLIIGYGHDVGNHGNNHKHMTQLSHDEMVSEIEGCHEIVKSIADYDMTLFRAPYGDYNEDVILTALNEKYQAIQWDVDSLDWKDYGVQSIIDTVLNHKNLRNGSIILLHNGSLYTAEALEQLLTGLEEKGYSFVPVSELIYTDGYYIDHTGRQYKTK